MSCFIGLFGVMLAVATLFLIKTRDLSDGGRALYLATFMLEFTAIPARMLLALFTLPFVMLLPAIPTLIIAAIVYIMKPNPIVFFIAGGILGLISSIYLLIVSIYPHARSLLYLLGLKGGAGFIMRRLMRARRLSERERAKYLLALANIQGNTKVKLRAPTNAYVIPGELPYAEVVGTEIYFTKALLHAQDKHLTAALAQALGYINSADGRLILALRRFVSLPLYLLAWASRATAPGLLTFGGGFAGVVTTLLVCGILALAGGGIGSLTLVPFWSEYWKRAQLRHDQYARHLGQGHRLISYIEEHQVYRVPVPFFSPEEDGELRIEALSQGTPVTARLVPQGGQP